jgi:tRNA threonylcarbamoyl adenosine modification protein YeaZ
MKILALELSSSIGSVALLDGGVAVFSVEFPNDRKHSGSFFEKLRECRQRFGNADRVVVGLGPGSYAGTRIAIATAIGLQAATGAELLGLASICALSANIDDVYGVIGDARRQSFFFAEVRNREAADGPMLLNEEELRGRLASFPHPVFTTEPLPLFPQAIVSRPSALVLAQMALIPAPVTAEVPLEPIYLREPHITQAKAVPFSTL